MQKTETKNNLGFTLIELLVVVSIIALLSSITAIALVSARQKARNVKRLSDMTQMNTGLELYFAANKGYPSATSGVPQGLTPTFASTLPQVPTPADGVCEGLAHGAACIADDPGCNGVPANTYYYIPSGTPAVIGGNTVYPDYLYYFCLGQKTGDFNSGERVLTPRGVR